MLGRIKQALAKTRARIAGPVENFFTGRARLDPESLERLEEALISADVGPEASDRLLGELRVGFERGEIQDFPALKRRLSNALAGLLRAGGPSLDVGAAKPFVIMVIGINGVGKTTTIAKLAAYYRKQGRSVILAAGDTFRAAAVEQLEQWGGRLGIPVIKHAGGADPSAVLYDGVNAAKSRGADLLIADTAGRLHTKSNLMEEMGKMKRVMGKALPGSPHEVLLVLDATTGQNGLVQAREFNAAVGVTGIVLAKLDGTARGGVVVPIVRELGIPVRFIGVGEGLDDLEPFSPEAFAEGFFE